LTKLKFDILTNIKYYLKIKIMHLQEAHACAFWATPSTLGDECGDL
jgi:hypothetical protein